MTFLPARSVSVRITAMVLAVVLLSVVSGFSLLAFLDYGARRRDLVTRTALIALVAADEAAGILAFGYRDEAARALARLALLPDFERATLYDPDGLLFADQAAQGYSGSAPPARIPAESPPRRGVSKGYVYADQPVLQEGRRYGTMRLLTSAAPLHDVARRDMLVLFGTGSGILLLALFFTAVLQRWLSTPLLKLATAVRQVALSEDYSLRVKHAGTDELGVLTEGFNAMMFTIARRQRERDQALGALRESHAHLEDAVRARTQELQIANQDLDLFSSAVSHDLHAPLRKLSAFSALLLERCAGRLDSEARGYLEVIARNTRRMEELINDLLAFAHADRAQLRRAAIDMTALAREVVEDLRDAEPSRPVEVAIRPLAAAEGDPAMIRQVLSNLVANAFKFTRRRAKPRIEIGCTANPGETVYFVKDNGAGFDPAQAHRLFAPFQRLHAISEFEGTGIGLALVHRIVSRHGGSVRAEGNVDGGATFYFTLPSRG